MVDVLSSLLKLTGWLLVLSSLCLCATAKGWKNYQQTWPQPHKNYTSRPTPNPYCQAGVIPFCPTGLPSHTMPKVKPTDTLFVYAMKAPVWEFKFGDLLKNFNIMHDAIGFHHVQSGLNFTMEWYELFQLFNCTFPHEPRKNNLTWCNQGATCIYAGIDEKHWKQNGTLVKVSQITGDTFNNFAVWTETDNNTYPYYETWTIMDKPAGQVYFNPFDCASWVLRAFDKLHEFGAQFNQSVHLNYTKIILYSYEPKLFADASTMTESKKEKLYNFYAYFQAQKSIGETIVNLLKYISKVWLDDAFYLFYNDQYWLVPLREPYIALTYVEVKLPS